MMAIWNTCAVVVLVASLEAAEKYHSFVVGPFPPDLSVTRHSCDEICQNEGGTCDANEFQKLSGEVLQAWFELLFGSPCDQRSLRTSSNAIPHALVSQSVCAAVDTDAASPVPSCSATLPTDDYTAAFCICAMPNSDPCPDTYTFKNYRCYKFVSPDAGATSLVEAAKTCYNAKMVLPWVKRNSDAPKVIAAARSMGADGNFWLENMPNHMNMFAGNGVNLDDSTLFHNGINTVTSSNNRLYVNTEGKMTMSTSYNTDINDVDIICASTRRVNWKTGGSSKFEITSSSGQIVSAPSGFVLDQTDYPVELLCYRRCARTPECFALNWEPKISGGVCTLLAASADILNDSLGMGANITMSSSPDAYSAKKALGFQPCSNCGG